MKTILKTATMALFISLFASCLGGGGGGGSSKSGGTGDGGGEPGGGSSGENICQDQPGEWVQVAVGRVFVSSDSSIGPADRIEAYNNPYVCNKSSISVASGKKLYLNGSSLSATQVKVTEEDADIMESQISDSLIEGNNYIFKSRIIRSTVKDSDVNVSKLSDSTVTDSYLYEVEGSNCSLSGENLEYSGC